MVAVVPCPAALCCSLLAAAAVRRACRCKVARCAAAPVGEEALWCPSDCHLHAPCVSLRRAHSCVLMVLAGTARRSSLRPLRAVAAAAAAAPTQQPHCISSSLALTSTFHLQSCRARHTRARKCRRAWASECAPLLPRLLRAPLADAHGKREWRPQLPHDSPHTRAMTCSRYGRIWLTCLRALFAHLCTRCSAVSLC